MEDTRRHHLARSLRAEIDRNCPGNDVVERLVWLLRQYHEYLQRWLALGEASSAPMESLLRSDLYEMLLIADRVMHEEINKLADSNSTERVWHQFSEVLVALGASRERNDFFKLRALFELVRRNMLEVLTQSEDHET